MKFLTRLFIRKSPKRYKGVADFFHRASYEEQIEVIREAAERALEDQRKISEQARAKTRA